MTSQLKTGIDPDISFLVEGETANATDVTTTITDITTQLRNGQVAVSADDTHVKHLFNALSAGANISLTVLNDGADESIVISLTGVVAAAFGGLGADISGISGILKLASGTPSAAVAGTDYVTPAGAETLENKTLDATNDINLNALDTGANPSSYVLAPDGSGGVTARAEGGGGATPVDFTITAGERLEERDAVYLSDADSKWYKIDMDAVPIKCGRLRGIVNESGGIDDDATGSARILGEISGYSGLTAWANVYASGTAGGLTQTRPNPTSGGSQVAIADMGWATSATAIMVAPDSVRYAKRDTLANDATLTVEHHTDTAGRNRIPRTFISSTSAGAAVVSHADSNRDDAGRIREQVVATYTSDLCTGGTATADTEQGGFEASKAFDDNTGTRWASSSAAFPHWLEYEFTQSRIIRRYTITGSSFAANQSPTDFELQYYDGSTWQTADSQSGVSWSVSEQKTFDISMSYSSARWRIYATAAGANTVSITEAEMMEAATYTDTITKLMQTFTLASEADIASIGLYLKKTGTPTDTLTCRIETVSGGNPTDTLVDAGATAALAESPLSTAWAEAAFDFAAPVTLAAGTYAIVLSSDGAPSEVDYVEWGSDSSSPAYAGGEMKSYAPSTWTALTADAIFSVYESGTTYNEPAVIGRWSGGTRDFAAQYADGNGADGDTKTTIKNTTGVPQDVTLEVEVA